MELIIQGIIKAFELIISFDPEVMGITWLSLKISGTATFISLFIGVSIGTIVALTNFHGKRLVISLINTGMGLPPVVVGLFVTIMIWRSGPLGFLEILYTPYAMIIAQAIIATPIVMGISLACHSKPAAESALADSIAGRKPVADGVGIDQRSETAASGGCHGRFRRRHFRSRRFHYGRW